MRTKKIFASVAAFMAAASVMTAAAFAEAPISGEGVEGEITVTAAPVDGTDAAVADAEKAEAPATDVAAPETGSGNAVTTGTDTAAPASDKDNPDSGVVSVAAVLGVAAVAAGAMVVAKKRK